MLLLFLINVDPTFLFSLIFSHGIKDYDLGKDKKLLPTGVHPALCHFPAKDFVSFIIIVLFLLSIGRPETPSISSDHPNSTMLLFQ